MSRRRAATAAILVVLMAGFGAGVNRYLASRSSRVDAPPVHNPVQFHPQFTLPGSIYFAAGGGLYSLHGSTITELQPPGQGWTQPVLLPDGSALLAVKVTTNYFSDLYELNLDGSIESQLSHDSGKVTATQLGNDDWIAYPAVGPGDTLYFSYDWPKGGVCEPGNGYQVDYSIWSTTLGTEIDRAGVVKGKDITQQSWANYYTGGDVSPVPLLGGGLVYVDYESAYGDTGELSTPLAGAVPGTEVSQIRLDPKGGSPATCAPGEDGTALTQPGDDCAQPALNPDQTEIAMICTPVVAGAPSSAESDLVVASFDAATGTLGPLQRQVTGVLAASPTWSPDGQDLLYLAPEGGDGYFQLWYLKGATAAVPGHPRQITSNLDLDATAAPAWADS
ncbi:MAG TPA: hypothetical protein VEK76_06370 [Candidatus Binatia bacterium]|nr:hypothetical protein [Candidatus Binatia bacterium]